MRLLPLHCVVKSYWQGFHFMPIKVNFFLAGAVTLATLPPTLHFAASVGHRHVGHRFFFAETCRTARQAYQPPVKRSKYPITYRLLTVSYGYTHGKK